MAELKNPKVSIIVPVYNVDKYLDACIKSVVDQSYNNLELILVDDGSPDNSPKICDEWAKKDSRVKVIHKANGGVSSARNCGLDVATGEYVTFLDSDDTINKNFSIICQSLQNNSWEILIVPLNKIKDFEDMEYKLDAETYQALIKNESLSISSSCSKIYKRDIIGENRFLIGVTIAEDKEFVVRVLTQCKTVGVINKPFYEYRDNPESVMNDRAFYLIKKLFDSTDKIVQNISTYNVADSAKEQIREVFASNLYGSFRFYKACNKQERKMVKDLIKSHFNILSTTKEKSKKVLYFIMRSLSVGFALNLLSVFRKLKIVK